MYLNMFTKKLYLFVLLLNCQYYCLYYFGLIENNLSSFINKLLIIFSFFIN